jgi:hypothetical protein
MPPQWSVSSYWRRLKASIFTGQPNPPGASKKFMRALGATFSSIPPIDISLPISMSRVLG